MKWQGVIERGQYEVSTLESRDAIANAAKEYDWQTVVRLLDVDSSLVNTWRVGGKSWYAPLHQAAHGGASSAVVERLITLGAWRSLCTAGGERAVDIARACRHEHLVGMLEPILAHEIDASVIVPMQRHFHDVIRDRIAAFGVLAASLRFPELGPVMEYASATFWFPIPGMRGGFSFWLTDDAARPTLMTESWSRVVEGSGERHEVTPAGARLVDAGFV